MVSSTSPESPADRRRQLSRQVRDAFPAMGVYAVHNHTTGAVRVCASRNVPGALNRLRFELCMNQHRDRALQQAWNAAGEQAVSVEVLDMVRERTDPAFDHEAELQVLLALWTDELVVAGSAR